MFWGDAVLLALGTGVLGGWLGYRSGYATGFRMASRFAERYTGFDLREVTGK